VLMTKQGLVFPNQVGSPAAAEPRQPVLAASAEAGRAGRRTGRAAVRFSRAAPLCGVDVDRGRVFAEAAAGADGHSSIQMTFDRGHLFTSVVDDHEKFERIANEIGLVA